MCAYLETQLVINKKLEIRRIKIGTIKISNFGEKNISKSHSDNV